MKEKRQRLDSEFINNASAIIGDKFLNEFGNYESFAIYWEINGEDKTSDLIDILLQRRKTIYLPIYRKSSIGFGLYDRSNVVIKKMVQENL